jgi:hypothetical protein
VNSPHLIYSQNSGESFYFRHRIPTDLLEHFGGVKKFRISLKCAIKSRATKTTKILAKILAGIYEEIREGMKSLDIEQIKEILRVEIRKQLLTCPPYF